MSDCFTPTQRSAVMRAVKGRDTSAELRLRRLLWAAGHRYRLSTSDLPGRPDLIFPGRRLAVFMHGCFWHGHDCRRGARVPKSNGAYWAGKIARNRTRDEAVGVALQALGWRVVVVWECALGAGGIPEPLASALSSASLPA